MRDHFLALFYLIYQFIDRRFAIRIRFSQAQTTIAMSRDRKQHYILSPRERQWLLSIGAEVNHDVKDLLQIVTWKTYRRWLQEEKAGRVPQQVGRKKSITRDVINLIIRMAQENVTWGKIRIVGELLKLNITVSVSTVMRILRKAHIEPPPDKTKRPVIPWATFVHAHLDSIIATDFFTQPVWTLRGRFDAYCLFFIHLGTRKVYCSPVTLHPDERWVMQQARNVAMWMEDNGIRLRFMLHDHDTKYTVRFDAFFNQIIKEHAAPKRGQVIKTMVRVPQMNGFAESFVASIKREVLNHVVCISLSQVDYLINRFTDFYNAKRPHQGTDIGNRVLDADFKPQSRGAVKSASQLGGLLRHYYRDAA